MSTITQPPTIQEVNDQVKFFSDHIIRTAHPSILKPIAAYGMVVGQSNIPKPDTMLLRDFYRAFVSIPMHGYKEFVARFNGNEAEISFFEDRIAAAVAIHVLAGVH